MSPLLFLLLSSIVQPMAPIPEQVAKHLQIGPIRLGYSVSKVQRILGMARSDNSPDGKARLCYHDQDSTVELTFEENIALNRVAIGHGVDKDCDGKIPNAFRPVRLWRWAGGIVSKPLDRNKLLDNANAWMPPGRVDGFWHLNLDGCSGTIDYEDFAGYSFVFGPVSCGLTRERRGNT
jgi:hypothetical protein